MYCIFSMAVESYIVRKAVQSSNNIFYACVKINNKKETKREKLRRLKSTFSVTSGGGDK